jgi:lipoyl(octanoyl) transferase
VRAPCVVHSLSRVEYADGLELMAQFTQSRREGAETDALLLLEHYPVLTLGRGALATHIIAHEETLAKEGVERFETDRGGDVTYHGPGQLVGYPLLWLEPGRQDVRKYVRSVEEVAIRTLADFGITGQRIEKWPGVWVAESRKGGPRKICAIGVHLSRWYTRHGFALNIAPNLAHFQLIVPCGISEAGVTSMHDELGEVPPRGEVEASVVRHFADVFECQMREAPPAKQTVAVAVEAEGHVLLLRRSAQRGGHWQLVTGHVEAREEPAQAAARELFEETGLNLKPSAAGVPHVFAFGPLQGKPELLQEYTFRVSSPNRAPPVLSAEHTEFAWVTSEQAQSMLPFAGLRRLAR